MEQGLHMLIMLILKRGTARNVMTCERGMYCTAGKGKLVWRMVWISFDSGVKRGKVFE